MDMLSGNSAGHALQKVCFAASGTAHNNSMKGIFKEPGQKDEEQKCGIILLTNHPKTAKKLIGVFG